MFVLGVLRHPVFLDANNSTSFNSNVSTFSKVTQGFGYSDDLHPHDQFNAGRPPYIAKFSQTIISANTFLNSVRFPPLYTSRDRFAFFGKLLNCSLALPAKHSVQRRPCDEILLYSEFEAILVLCNLSDSLTKFYSWKLLPPLFASDSWNVSVTNSLQRTVFLCS